MGGARRAREAAEDAEPEDVQDQDEARQEGEPEQADPALVPHEDGLQDPLQPQAAALEANEARLLAPPADSGAPARFVGARGRRRRWSGLTAEPSGRLCR